MFHIKDLWDNLLDTRIRLQKSVVQTNVLPLVRTLKFMPYPKTHPARQPSDIKVSEMADIQDAVMGTLLEASSLLEDIFKLQEVWSSSSIEA